MKKIVNNKIIYRSIISILIIIILAFAYTIFREYNVNKKYIKNNNKNDKYLLVKYTLANKDILKENDDMDVLWRDHPEALFTIVQDYVKLTKDGKYYIADLNYVNKKALGKVINVDFALNNNNGNVLADAEFDYKTLKAKLPAGYFKKFEDQSNTPLQAQVLSLTTKDNINNVKIEYTKDKVFKDEKRTITNDVYSLSTSIPVVKAKSANIYNKNDIELYVNDERYYINKDNSKYYKDSGTLDIGRNPLLIQKIVVKTSKKTFLTNIVDNILGINSVAAEYRTFDQMASLGTITTPINFGSEMDVGYPYYFGNEYSGGSGTIISLTGSGGVVTPPISSANVPSSYGFGPESTGYIVNGYNNSYNKALYGSTGATDNSGTYWSSVTGGNTIGDVVTDGSVESCTVNSSGTCVANANATRAMKLPKKVWYYTGWDTGTADWSNPTGEYDFNLYSAWSQYDGWVALYCGHTTRAQQTSTESTWENWIGLTILKIDTTKKYIVVAFSTWYRYGTQTGYGVYKFNYQEENKECLTITKKDQETSEVMSNVGFTLYNDSSCTSVAASELFTNQTGQVTFSDLEPGDYYIKETTTKTGYYNSGGCTKVSTSSTCPNYERKNQKKYYCYKIKKRDANKAAKGIDLPLPNFSYQDNKGATATTGADGYAVVFTGSDSETRTVTETAVTPGYERTTTTKTVTPSLMTEGASSTDASACNAEPTLFENWRYVVNWYKEYEEEGRKANNAKFKIKTSNGKYVVYNGTDTIVDKNNVEKKCYVYSGTTDNISQASEFVSGANGENGGVCVWRMPEGTYSVIETEPAANHTYSGEVYKSVTASTTFNSNTVFKNKPTEVEVTKTVTDPDRVSNDALAAIFNQLETLKLKKIPFNVYATNGSGAITGQPLSFVLGSDGVYDLESAADVSGTATTDVYLNDNRKIRFRHLAWGNYAIVEKGAADGACVCEGDVNCIGYYFPEQSSRFTVTKCSSSSSASASAVNQQTGTTTCSSGGLVNVNVDNHPTELWFTKKDFYGYEDKDDVVDFVDDNERSDFDRITFKVKDENGNYMKFVEVGNHVTDSSKVCLNDNDYKEYRYITDDEIAALGSSASSLNIVTELHTCGGHIRITNLCRGKTYTVEEVGVPENSVFVLEKDDNGNNPSATYKIPCCDDDTTMTSTTTIIKDKGTRVRLEKRDAKYNYIIPDETTTFKVFQCEKNTECHPTDNPNDMEHATNVRKMMYFTPRAKLTILDHNIPIEYDEEDGFANGSVTTNKPSATDTSYSNKDDYEEQYEVYKAVSDSDKAKGGNFVTELHPDRGILIMRYLPAGYNYVLVETKAPQGYSLPNGRNAETKFNIVNNTVKVEEIGIPEIPVSLLIRKYDNQGNLLAGAEFTISEAKSCNFNIDADKVERYAPLNLKTIRDGIYEARPAGDTTIFKTCQNRPGYLCNDINNTLTHNKYEGTVGDFDNLLNERNEHVQIEEGEALIQYLDHGKCYVIEEVKAPNGYSLPEKKKDRFVLVKVTDAEQEFDTFEQLVNTPTPFTFFKLDEYNKPLDGAKYKLQQLDDNKVYKDVAVTKEVKENGEFYYRVDKNSTNYIMETKDGKATITYLEQGQYRVLEVEPPVGYELPKKTMNVATFFVDEKGKVYGSNIIANKPKTERREELPTAQAKLILNVQTGQAIVRYGLIIAVIVLAISGLIYVQRKNKK